MYRSRIQHPVGFTDKDLNLSTPVQRIKSYRAGLNFISFQNDPNRLFFILTDPRWMGRANFGGSPELLRQNILSVISAGMFFVPSKEKPFPGASILN
jgi:hypothetical protein